MFWFSRNPHPSVHSPQAPFATVLTDRDALVALFQATNRADWTHKSNWDRDAELSQWYVAEVNDQGRVVKVKLGRKNLKGILILLYAHPLLSCDVLNLLQELVNRNGPPSIGAGFAASQDVVLFLLLLLCSARGLLWIPLPAPCIGSPQMCSRGF